MPLQMWSLLVLLLLVMVILLVVLPPVIEAKPVGEEALLMSKPGNSCQISVSASSTSGKVNRNEPFLVEKMAMQAGASANVALALGKAYRSCNPNHLSAAVFIGVIKAESNFNPKDVSSAGAKGVMQLLSSTFRTYVKAFPKLFSKDDIFDPYENACAGLLYLNDNYEAWLGHVDSSSEALDLAVASYLTGVTQLKSSGYSSRIYDGNNFVSEYVSRVKLYARDVTQAVTR
ncbi:transglycosylase SLT domain-containing protein [Coprothermobacter platensis]|uniref:transglycosylase SLT domain-containing protein n=1 Tax=Coprothermobacter platensis TaxID=108819 RepID=UPI0003701680|nr:transglycosylase SLT domain-containing protein [Coprothermobacter platensis]